MDEGQPYVASLAGPLCPEGRRTIAMSAEPDGRAESVSIVVPTYREAENIPILVPRIDQAMRDASLGYEAVIVDDDSDDGSTEAVASLAERGLPVRIIVRKGERGLSTAVIRGFDESSGQILICMDADLSHPPEVIPTMVQHIRSGEADFVLGSRFCEGGSTDADWGLFRWLNSKVAQILARPLSRLADPMSGFFALPRSVYEQAQGLNPIGYKIALELIVKCPVERIREVPIHFVDRRLGRSKLNVREQLNYLRHLSRLYKHRIWGGS